MKLEDVPTVVLVASGKGGVGKTTVASDIARTAAGMGYMSGLIDVDVTTPNSPEVLGGEGYDIGDQRLSTHDEIVPPTVNGVQTVSKGLVLPDDVPILGGAEFRVEIIMDYIENVAWDGNTDIVVVDTPPGTGEEVQTVMGAVLPDYAVVVTTPHPSSVRDATKSEELLRNAGVPRGVVLNMAFIPHSDIVQHVDDSVDFTEIKGIGDAKADEIEQLMSEQVPQFDLFGYADGMDTALEAERVATVPYTTRFEARGLWYEDLIEDLVVPTPGVGATADERTEENA